MKNNTMPLRKLVFLAVLTAAALMIYTLEAQLPAPIPVPGVKLGLANIFSLTALLLYGRKEGFAVLLVRILLGSLFSGSLFSLLYSLCGGIVCMLCMMLALSILGENRIWAVSAFGALGHNCAQVGLAALIVQNAAMFAYLPVLLLSGIVTGIFTGLCVRFLLPPLRRFIRR